MITATVKSGSYKLILFICTLFVLLGLTVTRANASIDVATAGSNSTLAGDGVANLVLSSSSSTNNLLAVPDVTGLAQADAEATLTTAGFTIHETTAFSDAVAAGIVISQTPALASTAAPGSVVKLVILSGSAPASVAVPDITGFARAAAETALTDAGLVVGSVTRAGSDMVATGDVISENPLAGTGVAAGSAVNLVISTGPATNPAPSVVGLSQAAAQTAIIDSGLVVGSVTTARSDVVPAGNVISQNPVGGVDVAVGGSVDLQISSGPAQVVVPGVVGLNYSSATSNITGAGLVVGSVSTVKTRQSCGIVNNQTPKGGTSVDNGSAVDLAVTDNRTCNPI